MAIGQIDEQRRQDFRKYFFNLRKEWSIDESLQKFIVKSLLKQKGDRLENYIEAFKELVKYTDRKYEEQKHKPDTRKVKPHDIKNGKYVFCILERDRKTGHYPYTMTLYFRYDKVIYDFEIGREEAKILNE